MHTCVYARARTHTHRKQEIISSSKQELYHSL